MAQRRVGALTAAASASCIIAVAGDCTGKFVTPPAPLRGTDYNGITLDDVCFGGKGPHHVFLIGDWGGIANPSGTPVKPAWKAQRQLMPPIDVDPQQRVADQMLKRANNHSGSSPDYILNVGDSFYWGGIDARCGAPPFQYVETGKFADDFEHIYSGKGLDGVPWLGVLGNHDYGGHHFTAAWDQIIGYTWERPPPWTGRWIMPAQFWAVTVHYPDDAKPFSIDYFFLDSNVFDAYDPETDPAHNICGAKNNPPGASCGPQGPLSVADCRGWFERLWKDQARWLEALLSKSQAEWQVLVTHFPPSYGTAFWTDMAERHGVDLITTGHHHNQNVHYEDELLGPTAYIVSGGGGGIVSESNPDEEGHDDQYGFVDLEFTAKELTIVAISHGGQFRSTTKVKPRVPGQGHGKTKKGGHAPDPGPEPEPDALTAQETEQPAAEAGTGTPELARRLMV